MTSTENNNADQFITEMLTKHGIVKYRDLFAYHQDYSKRSMSTSCEALIRPFTLTANDHQQPTGLCEIALSNSSRRIQAINKEMLMDTLILKNPKKSFEFTPLIADLSDKSQIKISTKTKKAAQTKGKRELANSVDITQTRKKKRVRVESRQDSDDDNEQEQVEEYTFSSQELTQKLYKSYTNLQSVITKVFNQFWDEQLDPKISAPFFSLITRENCVAFGLGDYFNKVEDACTLTNIKERLDKGTYQFAETFIYDFNLMFDNVFLYYDKESPQFKKAVELKEKFSTVWEEYSRTLN